MNWSSKILSIIFSLFIFFSSFSQIYGQENSDSSLYEKYKGAIGDIDVIFEMKNGPNKTGGGSGFFIDKEGHMLTCAHVAKWKRKPAATEKDLESIKKTSYFITLHATNRKYRAKLLGSNDYADAALLQVLNIQPEEYTSVKLGDPNKLKIGDKDFALGHPRSLANSLTTGIISYLGRHHGDDYIEDLIQTDCPINFGNSGCPVFNADKEVVGIVHSIILNSDGLAFAQSLKVVDITRLMRGEIDPAQAGFECMLDNFARFGRGATSPGVDDQIAIRQTIDRSDMDDVDLAALANATYDGKHFAIITSIDDFEDAKAKKKIDGAAKRAGLEKGDLIISIDGINIVGGMDLRIFLASKRPGDKIKIFYNRAENGKMLEKHTTLTLTKRILADKDSSADDEGDEDSSKKS